jgi:DUF971 family protein
MSLLELVETAVAQMIPDFGTQPKLVTLRRDGRSLAMAEATGAETRASAEALRLACRCAWCSRARIDGTFPAAAPEARITFAEPIGGYALRLHFSDGHDRGIFPWSFIRDIAASAAAATPIMETPDA